MTINNSSYRGYVVSNPTGDVDASLTVNSTLTYANRYDLDEISVFLEGNGNNPMYFSISGLPDKLSYGRHYFNISILDSSNQIYELKPSSRILFEFKSFNNVILKSDVTPVNQFNGVATCFVDVLKDPLRTEKSIADGEGTLTLVGCLVNKGANDPSSDNYISPKFQGAMNYRCTFPIEIRKNLLGANSPILTNTQHNTQTSLGQFSFARASIGSGINSNIGIEYTPTGEPNDGSSQGGSGGSIS